MNSAPAPNYRVLARTFRPSRFEDLLGQQAMLHTLHNAFELGRIAHAFMLTGVRGVGKTTTARLLARALNYSHKNKNTPSMQLDPPGIHCNAISCSQHPDVLELDAASRTGVADMRELLDGVRYAPISARYKVYIIDEVHMLSIAAFNALLKTLEEPPQHVKFIFATTEIRKVPVTVLSRCQRFGLARLDMQTLTQHLKHICQQEQANIHDDALTMIARAAEGSVRDALSILDQAITNGKETPVNSSKMRDMLGVADRSRLLDLLEAALSANTSSTLQQTETLLNEGADPHALLKDLLDAVTELARAEALAETYSFSGPAEWKKRTQKMAERLSTAQISRLYRLLLTGLQDCSMAPDPDAAACMVTLRLAAACSLPWPEQTAKSLPDHPRIHEAFKAFPDARILEVKTGPETTEN